MEIINEILSKTIDSFDFALVIVINIVTYLTIVIAEAIKGSAVKTWSKRIIMIVSCVFVGIIYTLFDGYNPKLILNSCILAPVAWSWLGKPICNFLKIDYKNKD